MGRGAFTAFVLAVVVLAFVLPRDGQLILSGWLLGVAGAGRLWKPRR
jgi:hypothetical protein